MFNRWWSLLVIWRMLSLQMKIWKQANLSMKMMIKWVSVITWRRGETDGGWRASEAELNEPFLLGRLSVCAVILLGIIGNAFETVDLICGIDSLSYDISAIPRLLLTSLPPPRFSPLRLSQQLTETLVKWSICWKKPGSVRRLWRKSLPKYLEVKKLWGLALYFSLPILILALMGSHFLNLDIWASFVTSESDMEPPSLLPLSPFFSLYSVPFLSSFRWLHPSWKKRNAKDEYCDILERELAAYKGKTSRQKYMKSKEYEQFRNDLWVSFHSLYVSLLFIW